MGKVCAGALGAVNASRSPLLSDALATLAAPLSPKHPYHPRADTFDVLSGDLATLPDLTQAARIKCDVPGGRAPIAGERLSVVDPQPAPTPGTGRYYLVAAQRGGEERIGRQRLAGELSGRPVMGLVSLRTRWVT